MSELGGIQRLSIEDLPADIRRQMEGMSRKHRKKFNKRIIGRAMELVVKIRFALAQGPGREDWKSSAPKTKHAGKFSVNYNERPSGSPVTAGARRLSDTGKFAEAFRILHYGASHVTVGPLRSGKGGKAPFIAHRAETDWGNHITGWDEIATGIVSREIGKGLEKVMRGGDLEDIPRPTPWSIRRQF